MLGRGNRTFICSVVFIDIIEYSKKPVAEQIQHKERLNALLAEALKDVAANDRIILDTGDGAAISFVGDPEDALFVCLGLRDAMAALPKDSLPLHLRVGINLGPVKLIRDLNDQPNIIGDGINVAQRVMSFADANQILVSRSYYEVVSCLSDAYARLFRYQGSRTDKHVREHEVYAVGETTTEIKRHHEATGHSTTAGVMALPGVAQSVISRISRSASEVTENLRTRPRLGTAMAVVAILVIAVVIRGMREQPEPVVEAPRAAGVPRVAEVPAPTAPAAKPAAAPRKDKTAAAPAPPPAKRAPEPKPSAVAGDPGTIAFAIAPWGEIYVDGKKVGVSPPLREVQVSPGEHKVEIRNTTFPAHVQTVEVQPGEQIRIRHKFR